MSLHPFLSALGTHALCGECGRSIPFEPDYRRKVDWTSYREELGDWLIYLTTGGRLIVRCPQHIGMRQLEETVGRTSKRRRWAEDARRRDSLRNPDTYNPFIVPQELGDVDALD